MILSGISALLILHGLIGVALLGAITHQSVALFRKGSARDGSFVSRYVGVHQRTFTNTIAVLYLVGVILGGTIYPYYRLNVRIPFEEMRLARAVGLFELKEHFAAIGLGVLALYVHVWQRDSEQDNGALRMALTLILAFIVWWDFLIGHILNNIRGFA